MSGPGLLTLTRKNFLKRPYRNAILIICVAAVVVMQLSSKLIDRSSQQGLDLCIRRMGADLIAVPHSLNNDVIHSYLTGQAATFYMNSNIKKLIQGHDFVDTVTSQLYIKSLSGASCCSAGNIFLIGFEPETDFVIKPWLVQQKRIIEPDEIILGSAIQTKPGAPMKFYGHEFKVAGTLEEAGMGFDTSMFIPLNTAYLMSMESQFKAEKTLDMKDKISAVLVKLKPENVSGIPRWKAAEILGKSIPGISLIHPMDIRRIVQRNLKGLLDSLLSLSYVIWPITALLIGLVFAMAANERQREIGLLRAMGARRTFIFSLIIAEALVVAGSGAIIGIIISVGTISAFSRYIAINLAIPFQLPDAREISLILAVAALLALVTGTIAALIPAYRSSMQEPYEAIRRGV